MWSGVRIQRAARAFARSTPARRRLLAEAALALLAGRFVTMRLRADQLGRALGPFANPGTDDGGAGGTSCDPRASATAAPYHHATGDFGG